MQQSRSSRAVLRTALLMVMVMVLWLSLRAEAQARVDWMGLRLPEEHMPFYFYNNPDIRDKCSKDEACPYKAAVESSVRQCWGYEENCPQEDKLVACHGDSKNWASNKDEQRGKFWDMADFGYLRQRRKELKSYCTPQKPGDSSLTCVDHLLHCQATNVFVDLSTANVQTSTNPYREDVLSAGQIGGSCKLDKTALKSQLDHRSPLQSWAAELGHFVSVPEKSLNKKTCDVVITKPTFIIKLDATVNMYHHFCDYVNLYLSQHLNNSFSTDVNVFIWDTSGHQLSKMFAETWAAFSDTAPLLLKDFDGKKVCFKQAVFSFLARMRLGFYYNMPLIPGCEGSSLMRAFSHHLLHRLNIPQHGPLRNKIRVTLLSRSTRYRQIMNQEESKVRQTALECELFFVRGAEDPKQVLVRALHTDFEFEVRLVDFNRHMPFLDQLEISHNSDILIGIHGAGLTHLLFQPDWAVIIELYNCEDGQCYYDLARLRGIRYLTWEKKDKLTQEDEGHHPTLGAHAKFTNYAFDVDEFMQLVQKAAEHVRTHPAFLAARTSKYPQAEPHVDEPHVKTSDPELDITSINPPQTPQTSGGRTEL